MRIRVFKGFPHDIGSATGYPVCRLNTSLKVHISTKD
jgi:hypothetical protein